MGRLIAIWVGDGILLSSIDIGVDVHLVNGFGLSFHV